MASSVTQVAAVYLSLVMANWDRQACRVYVLEMSPKVRRDLRDQRGQLPLLNCALKVRQPFGNQGKPLVQSFVTYFRESQTIDGLHKVLYKTHGQKKRLCLLLLR